MERFEKVLAELEGQEREAGRTGTEPRDSRPFVTLSRQAGAGGHTVQEKLVARLRVRDPADREWMGFDREIVELAAGDDRVVRPLVEGVGERSRSLVEEMLSQIIVNPRATELAAYRRVAHVMRALARTGRVVLIGRGGVFLTRNMPGGVHVHLVAPFPDRVKHMRRLHGWSREEADGKVREIDENRRRFFRRYWPQETMGPEAFSGTYNTANLGVDGIVDSVIALLPGIPGNRPVPAEQRVAIGE